MTGPAYYPDLNLIEKILADVFLAETHSTKRPRTENRLESGVE